MSPPDRAGPPFGPGGGWSPGQPPGHPWGPPAQYTPQYPPQYPQPQYPQQGPSSWGPPSPGPAPRPPRTGVRRLALALAVLLLLGALVLVALLAFVTGPRFARVDVLDRAAVERGVSDVVTRDWRRGITGVTCPEGVRARAGESFVCSATVDGRPRRIPVDVLDERGTYQVGQPR